MKSYGQYCGLAQALDVVGDRWSLLIVRELLMRDGCRYTDLQYGLPGVATNLLATRLKDLEDAGLVTREDAPPPVATTLYHLTERGRQLQPALRALGAWGAATLPECPAKGTVLRAYWLEYVLAPYLKDGAPEEEPISIEVRVTDEPVTISVGAGRVRVEARATAKPDAVVEGNPKPVIRLLRGAISLRQAKAAGVNVAGDARVLKRLAVA